MREIAEWFGKFPDGIPSDGGESVTRMAVATKRGGGVNEQANEQVREQVKGNVEEHVEEQAQERHI